MYTTNDSEAIERRWFKDGDEVTSGSATVQITRYNSGMREWLQDDESSWDTSKHTFDMTHDGEKWVFEFTVPNSSSSFNITATATHSDPQLPPLPETHYVTVNDLDDIASSITGSSPTGDVEFVG